MILDQNIPNLSHFPENIHKRFCAHPAEKQGAFFVAAWFFHVGGTFLSAYRQRWQTKPQQFPKENSGEGDILSPRRLL